MVVYIVLLQPLPTIPWPEHKNGSRKGHIFKQGTIWINIWIKIKWSALTYSKKWFIFRAISIHFLQCKINCQWLCRVLQLVSTTLHPLECSVFLREWGIVMFTIQWNFPIMLFNYEYSSEIITWPCVTSCGNELLWNSKCALEHSIIHQHPSEFPEIWIWKQKYDPMYESAQSWKEL